jgi:glucose/arabinose dehydrogenase
VGRLRKRLTWQLPAALLLSVAVAGCTSTSSGTAAPSFSPPVTAGPAPTEAPAQARDVATGLTTPWGIAFLPGGDALVSERDTGKILRLPAGGGTPVEAARIDGVDATGESGLLGLAVPPDYQTAHWVYAYFTGAEDNRVVRLRLGDAAAPQPVLTGIPKGSLHDGGRLAFGPDGLLYVSTGETGDRSLAQDLGSLGGKILRITPDGKPAPGNPFPGSPVFSYGHRNVEGLTFDEQGRLYASEFGSNSFDELNLIVAGGNYGWPAVEGHDPANRYRQPLVTWTTDEASPSGIVYVSGVIYVAALRGERLWRVNLRTGAKQALLDGTYGRLRTVVRTPDGRALWVSTSNTDGRGDPRPGDDRIVTIPLSGGDGRAAALAGRSGDHVRAARPGSLPGCCGPRPPPPETEQGPGMAARAAVDLPQPAVQ